jgi:spermidine synthase
MELTVLLWILGGGFGGTWGLCIFFMIQSSNANAETRKEIVEIRKEISALHHCVKDHHARISVIESRG